MLEMRLPSCGVEIEIWPRNFIDMHGQNLGVAALAPPNLSRTIPELKKKAISSGALNLVTNEGGVYEVKTFPSYDVYDLGRTIRKLASQNIVPEQSRHASSMHVSLGVRPAIVRGLHECDSWQIATDQLYSSALYALRVTEVLGATVMERLARVGVLELHSVEGVTMYRGWNSRGCMGVCLAWSGNSVHGDWVGEKSLRLELRTPRYVDVATTLSTVAVLQSITLAKYIEDVEPTLFRNLGIRESALHCRSQVDASGIVSHLPEDVGRWEPIGEDECMKLLRPSLDYMVDGKRNSRQGRDLLKSVNYHVNDVRKAFGQKPIRLVFS